MSRPDLTPESVSVSDEEKNWLLTEELQGFLHNGTNPLHLSGNTPQTILDSLEAKGLIKKSNTKPGIYYSTSKGRRFVK